MSTLGTDLLSKRGQWYYMCYPAGILEFVEVKSGSAAFAFLGCIALGTLVTAALATGLKPDFDVTVADLERESTEPPASPSD